MARQIPHLTPLIDIHNADFGKAHEQGLWWSMFGDREEDSFLDDMYLVDNLKMFAAHGWFTTQPHSWLSHIGFFVGMLHGGILAPETGDIRPGITTLVTFTNKGCMRGYRAGREWFFDDAEPHEQRRTDSEFIERLRESISDMLSFGDSDDTWNFSIGCVIGELSGQLFPMNEQEQKEHIPQHQWLEEASQRHRDAEKDLAPQRNACSYFVKGKEKR